MQGAQRREGVGHTGQEGSSQLRGMERVTSSPAVSGTRLEEIREPGFEIKIHRAGSLLLSHLGSSVKL